MSLNFTQNSVIAAPGQQYPLSQLINVTPGNLPEYVVLTGLDRVRYAATSTGEVGSLAGNQNVASFVGNAQTSDAVNIGLVFKYTDQGYFNATYGYLTNLKFTASLDNYRSEYLSLYGFGTAGVSNDALFSSLTALSNSSTGNPSLQFFMAPPSGCTPLGSLDVVTRMGYVDATPNLATPNEIAAVASSFVGKVWNDNGCWVLVSDIAASAGASLPVNSAVPRSMAPPGTNGEWIVAFDSSTASAAQRLTWQTQLKTGDIVGFDEYCGGHIVTVASGSGYGATIIDNVGVSAKDGSSDIIIGSARGAAGAFSNALPQGIVIYRLDTPVVTPVASMDLKTNASALLAGAFSTQDPAGKQVVSYQVYDTGSGAAQGSFSIDGVSATAHSSDHALTIQAASLATASFTAGGNAGSDSIMVRAFNGVYWGDWQSIDVNIGSGIRTPTVHVTTDQTVVRVGGQISLSSLVTASSPDSPIVSYTIHDPAGPETGSGHILLNGAVNLLGTPVNAANDMTYRVSAADFSKLTYVGGGFLQNGDALTITASNAAQQTSRAVDLQIMNVGLGGSGIAHYLASGTEIPVTQMFTVTGVDSNSPIKYYIFSLDPTLSDTLNLNGATNLFGSTLIGTDGWAHYEISAADLGKVTFTAGSHTNQYGNELLIAASDGLSTANAFSLKHEAVATPLITEKPGNAVSNGETVALASLFSTGQDVGNLNFHIYDPQGGGLVNLNGVTNLMGKEALAGECIVSGHDIGLVTYTGGGSEESLLIAASNSKDGAWAQEITVHVTGIVNALAAAGLNSQSQAINVAVTDRAANIAANIDALGVLANAGKLSGITLTDNGVPTLSISPTQLTTDAAALNMITSGFALDVRASAESQTLCGLNGHINTAMFGGAASNYTLTQTGSAYTVKDNVGADGTDTVINIERLKFSDVSIALDTSGNAGQVYRLYQAAFDRTPDKSGLGDWIYGMDTGMSLLQVSAGFVNSQEFKSVYGQNPNDSEVVTRFYQNVLHRAPEQTGYDYWMNQLQSGLQTRTQVLTGFSESVENQAQVIGVIQNGIEYTQHVV